MSLINSLKNLITSRLTDRQTKFLRNIIEPSFLFAPLSKDSVLILGCQRSGTTLTYLILNSHPQVKGIDETETGYAFPYQGVLYRNSRQDYLTCLKLPNQTSNFNYICQHFPQTKIIAPMRDPYQVVSSMRSFIVQSRKQQGNWLKLCAKSELLGLGNTFFPEILALNLDRLDEISLGAYVWKYKSLAVERYKQAGFATMIFKYEELLNNPRRVIGKILNFTELAWDEIVLNHHQYYDGDAKRYPGGTRGDRPIEITNQKQQLNLSTAEIAAITSICQEQMKTYGYPTLATDIAVQTYIRTQQLSARK